MKYYTYAYLREDKTPYYIGKGKDNRINEPHRVAMPPKERRIYLKKNLTEEESMRHEIYMISVLGRKDLGTGILRNLTDGGEGRSGFIVNEETKAKIADTHKSKGIKPPSPKGKKYSKEHRAKMSKAQQKSWKSGNRVSGHTGKKHSEETKAKIRRALYARMEAKRMSEEV